MITKIIFILCFTFFMMGWFYRIIYVMWKAPTYYDFTTPKEFLK
jgi:hypothetical protein